MWNNLTKLVPSALLLVAITAAPADDFDIDWWTVDGGGDMWTTGGDFELSGTIGQPDAGPVMTGGDFELTGGFWAGTAGSGPQYDVGDCNCDGNVDFFDIDPFIMALVFPEEYEATYPDCDLMNADCNEDGIIDFFDITPFVELVTGG